MAVAVLHVSFVVLDEDDRIVEVGRDTEAWLGPHVGRLMWECFPEAEPLFRPYYDRARENGEPVEFVQYYAGRVLRVRAVPSRDQLELYWQKVYELDTVTIERLRSSIDHTLRLLDRSIEDEDRQGRVGRGGLRVIEGSA